MVEATKQPYPYDVLPHETIAGMAGRQVLDAIVDGRLPQAPISQVLNFWLTEVGDGVAAFEGEPRRIFSSPLVLSTAVGLSRSWTARGPAPRIRCSRLELDTRRSRPRGISQRLSRPRPAECAPRRVSSRRKGRLFRLKCIPRSASRSSTSR
jgi:hypothetical protein